MKIVKSSVQARLDDQSRKTLARLRRQMGWTPSETVREGLRLLAALHPARKSLRVIGMGQFESGIPDLGSNKKHLKGFGR